MLKLNVIAIGGAHQFPHFLPVIFELSARKSFNVEIFVARHEDLARVERLSRTLGKACPPVTVMRIPLLESRTRSLKFIGKKWRLRHWASRLRSADAIVCAERTSTILKKLRGSCPPMLHFRHGAGDRAAGFEQRISLFDHVLTIGEKDRNRTVEAGLVLAERCHVAGPIKLATAAFAPDRASLFSNDRPVILYNPHFDDRLGSFKATASRLIDSVLADERYNLVVAPHVRLAENWNRREIARWEARSIPDRLIVDMGSERSLDMTYILGANLYVGDVSSQVYEFIQQPRPCLFIDMVGHPWTEDPNFAMWKFGPVISPKDDLMAAIVSSFTSFERYRPVQAHSAAAAFGSLALSGCSLTRSQKAETVITGAASLIEDILSSNCPTTSSLR